MTERWNVTFRSVVTRTVEVEVPDGSVEEDAAEMAEFNFEHPKLCPSCSFKFDPHSMENWQWHEEAERIE